MKDARLIRQKIHLLKDLPPLPVMARKILSFSDDEADIAALADTIGMDPCLSARILGLANAAYFGWPGGVRTIYDAIYKVLGLKMVRNLAVGLILGGLFRSERSVAFRVERYWFNAVATAIMAQNLFRHVSPDLRNNLDDIYLDGLLHDLGLPVLVHLFPEDMDRVFAEQSRRADCSLSEIGEEVLGIGPCRAGALLARKWHLPEDMVRVIEHREDPCYGGDFWPIVLLVGYCARQAGFIYGGDDPGNERALMDRIGISEEWLEAEKRATIANLEGIREMALLFSENGTIDG